MILSNGVNVCGTWDTAMRREYGHGLIIEPEREKGEHKSVVQRIDFSSHIMLPNVPVPAASTWLAQFCRSVRRSHPAMNQDGTISLWHRVPAARDYQQWLYNTRRVEKRLLNDLLKLAKVRDVEPITMPELVGRLLGVEIECYPASPDVKLKSALWHNGTDGSLDSGGRELRKITWQDNNGRLRGLYSLGTKFYVNEKCGLHVHVDVRHIPAPLQVQTYDLLTDSYPALKALVPDHRLSNRYCNWHNNCPDSERFNYSDRYCALNWQSLQKHGTIEYRMQGGMDDIRGIECWALLCQYLTNFCATTSTSPKTLSDLLSILPHRLASWARDWHQRRNEAPKAKPAPKAMSLDQMVAIFRDYQGYMQQIKNAQAGSRRVTGETASEYDRRTELLGLYNWVHNIGTSLIPSASAATIPQPVNPYFGSRATLAEMLARDQRQLSYRGRLARILSDNPNFTPRQAELECCRRSVVTMVANRQAPANLVTVIDEAIMLARQGAEQARPEPATRFPQGMGQVIQQATATAGQPLNYFNMTETQAVNTAALRWAEINTGLTPAQAVAAAQLEAAIGTISPGAITPLNEDNWEAPDNSPPF